METTNQYFKWVSFDEVWQVLQEYFPADNFFEVAQYPYGPNPETIYRLAENKYGSFDLPQIPDWENYEYGKKNYPNTFFIEKLFTGVDFKDSPFFYIIINKCFIERRVLKVPGHKLNEFIDTSIDLIDEHIFQASDVIFVSNIDSKIAVLDHNGYYLSIHKFTESHPYA